MTSLIHPTALVDPGARLGVGVRVGANAVIGKDVAVGEGCEIAAGAQVLGPTTLGPANRIFPYACIGFEPQDLKFRGGRTRLEIGASNVFREFCTIHRGTEEGGGLTSIGEGNLFMTYTHVAHDCRVGNHTIFSNNATLAGHVEVQDDATVGAFSAVHQFCRIGTHAYVGAFSVITKDALPWMKTVGQKPLVYGVNSIGLSRKGFSDDRIRKLGEVSRILLRSGLNTRQASDKLAQQYAEDSDVGFLLEFVRRSERGIISAIPGRRGGRGGSAE